MTPRTRTILGTVLLTLAAGSITALHATASGSGRATTTPIKHVVVIYGENESFDHYFGTYPNATNPAGEPAFTAAAGTPAVDGLTPALLTANPNSLQPQRLDRSVAVPCDQDHSYTDEQKAFDGGAMDKFVQYTTGSCSGGSTVMDYYDGNTVTGLWNLAQHFTLADAFYGTQFGPSTPGALNLVSGDTSHAGPSTDSAIVNGAVLGDPDPAYDDCGHGDAVLSGKNVGDLMNTAGMTWGWFEGGFRPTQAASGSSPAVCGTAHHNAAGASVTDYVPHHEPFQYYTSTANAHHLPPTSAAMIGHADQANHQYDLTDFDTAVAGGNLPDVSFLKAAAFEDAHPGYSGPLDEQHFVARTLNELEQSPDWSSTAVIVTYDDSDGWYDHAYWAPVESSTDSEDALSGAGLCGTAPGADPAFVDRCGHGPRLPMLVISPYARVNSVSSTQLDQTSILKLIEDNWSLGTTSASSYDHLAGSMVGLFDFAAGDARAPAVYLDPQTGTLLAANPGGYASPNGGPIQVSPSSSPSPSATTSPAPAKPKATCTVKVSSTKVTLSCKESGLLSSGGKIKLKATVLSGRKGIVSTTGTVSKGKVTIKLKLKSKLKKGKYTLKLVLTQGRTTTTSSTTFKVR